jgi:N-methylhydantoinase A
MTGSFEALIPRDLRAEVPERIDAAGRVLTPLDEAAVRREVHRLRERGAEALVIHFIHAYANPVHEQRCGEIAREIWPNRFVTLGSEILREVREFERGSTAALTGYVQPIVSRYLGRLSQNLRSVGLGNELLVMQGNGGMQYGHRSRRAHRPVGPGRRSNRRGADRRSGWLSQSGTP